MSDPLIPVPSNYLGSIKVDCSSWDSKPGEVPQESLPIKSAAKHAGSFDLEFKMSADNEVCILKTKDGFRVKHIANSEELYIEYENSPLEHPVLFDYFHDAAFFETKEEAFAFAIKEINSLVVCEYGITNINYDFDFPSYTEEQMKNWWLWYEDYHRKGSQ